MARRYAGNYRGSTCSGYGEVRSGAAVIAAQRLDLPLLLHLLADHVLNEGVRRLRAVGRTLDRHDAVSRAFHVVASVWQCSKWLHGVEEG